MQSCAVIGCGAAGMVTSALLRQSGMLVTCFELAAEPGGVWSSNCHETFTPRGLLSPVYPAMRCTLPKDIMSFSDVRFDFTVPHLAHHSAVRHYLDCYAERKGVRGMTRFNTKVESVRWDDAVRRWRVLTVNITNGDIMEWLFDKVCVCTGRTHAVNVPVTIRDLLREFVDAGGEVLHTCYVKNFRLWRRKRVVVFGDDEWAYAYCNELRQAGAEVFHSLPGAAICSSASLFRAELSAAHEASSVSDAISHCGVPKSSCSLKWLTSAAQYLTRRASYPHHPGLSCGDERATADELQDWLQRHYRGTVNTVPLLGPVMGSEGKGILFDKLSRGEVGARADDPASGGSELVSTMPAATRPCRGEFVDQVDAVICATGFRLRYPFLPKSVRCAVEGGLTELQPLLPPCHTMQESDDAFVARRVAEGKLTDTHGLYLGTLFVRNPTLAFVGAQNGLLPPYLLYETQARFVAFAFTDRIELPGSPASLLDKERQLVECNPLLTRLYSPQGCGLASAVYHNVLQAQLGPGSRQTYAVKLFQRRTWLALSSMLSLVHKFRALAPLKRKQQHVLFSNCI